MDANSPPTGAPDPGARSERRWALAWALACSAVIGFPHLLHAFRYGSEALPLADGVDAPMYYVLAARAPSPADAGHAYDHVLFEESSRPLVRRYVSTGALAWAASWVGLGGPRLFLLMDLVCPFLLFLLADRWLRKLGAGAGLRIAACAWLVLCQTWFVQGAYYLLRGELDVLFLHMNRPLNPQWSLLWWMAGLLLLWRYVRDGTWTLQAGAALCGLYAESIQGPYLAGSFWFAWLLPVPSLWKKRDARALAAHGAWLAAAILLLKALVVADGLPGRFAFPSPPGPPDAALPASHAPLTDIGVLAGWALGVVALWRGPRADAALRFTLWTHLGILLAANQHVVTGQMLNPGHFLRPLKVTMALLACALLARAAGRWGRLRPGPRAVRLAGHAAGILFLANGLFVQAKSFAHERAEYDRLQQYRPALTWLAGQPRGVVACYSDETLTGSYRTQTAVLLETPHRVLTHALTPHLGYPTREPVVRWVFEHRVRGARSPDALEQKALQPYDLYDELHFGFRLYQAIHGVDVGPAVAYARRSVADTIREAWSLPAVLRVDYVVDGPFERAYFGPLDPALPWLRPAWPESPRPDEPVRVYRVDAGALRAGLDEKAGKDTK